MSTTHWVILWSIGVLHSCNLFSNPRMGFPSRASTWRLAAGMPVKISDVKYSVFLGKLRNITDWSAIIRNNDF